MKTYIITVHENDEQQTEVAAYVASSPVLRETILGKIEAAWPNVTTKVRRADRPADIK